VIVECPQCSAKYRYDESRFGSSGVRKLRCSHCGAVFEVRRPGTVEDTDASLATRDKTTKNLEMGKSGSVPEASLPQLAPLPANRRYSLAVILGANSGQIYQLSRPRVILGRGAGCDIQLPDSEVSRRHAMLEVRDDAATLVDLGSTNGTYVEGVRIDVTNVNSHQEFSLGTTTLMFIVTELHDTMLP
jgi:predicted Zn finger-like uncharacterized protein